MINREIIDKYDAENMFGILQGFPEQLRQAKSIGESIPRQRHEGIDRILILGMGGSAIGGDIVRDYLANIGAGPEIIINRDYDIPEYINENTLVIASSYSGNTEETLEAFDKASYKTSRLACITTGGMLKAMAMEKGALCVELPEGYQPRCAIGYSIFSVLYILLNNNIIDSENHSSILEDIDESLTIADELAESYSHFGSENMPLRIAEGLAGKIPVIYSSSKIFAAINARWRGQFHENAKSMAFGNLLPEMNHNEINSWSNPESAPGLMAPIFLRDISEHPRVSIRFDALKTILNAEVIEFSGKGKGLLARYMSLIIIADWITYYLALNYEENPTSIPAINQLKDFLKDH